ncbi:MAG: LytR family transcriptional regulator [Sulfobacillus thermosulfidooxidans]|uniref:LytR family transcriptional regulator n=1 Tax=Sulfobacillus thermosulfidooxidans TaxID=28034 RepID=A0A2T2X010_SULTH|nr:MAG: LytR family transcriptional regulator [Sulfobacillus thermosulfidooxidans]
MESRRRKSRKHRKIWPYLVGIGVLGVAASAIVYGMFIEQPAHALATAHVSSKNAHYTAYPFTHRVTFLLLGSSLETANHHDITAKDARNRTDTMILVSINPATKQVGVLSIPRDSRVEVPPVGKTKIAEASFFGGVRETVAVVENTFHIPVDYYAYLNLFQFAKIINDMGGLTVDVPQNEVYQPGGPLGIDLKKGVHHLNGQQVLEFVRFRNTSQGDIGRIQQQQQVLRDMAAQLLQPQEIPRWPRLAHDLISALSYTNLSTGQLLSLGLFAKSISLSSVRFATIPGYATTHVDPYMHIPLSYWHWSRHLTPLLIQNVLLGDNLTPQQKHSVVFQVESGTSSLRPAEQLAQKLQQQGYTVLPVGWANHHNHHRSVLINTTGDRYLGNQIASMLGPNQQEFTAYHTTPWDFKIVVGSDYSPPKGL